jgi:arylsulfatase A-like enzyme
LGLRTPVIFDWPGHVPVQHIDNPTSAIHLYATLLDFAGITAAPTLPSKSLKSVIQQQQKPTTEKLFGASYQAIAMHTAQDQTPRPERDIFALYVRDGDWKYVLYLRDVREEDNVNLTIKSGMQPFPARKAGDEDLFYLPDDIIELHNVAHEPTNSTRLTEYRKAVFDWWNSTGGKPLDSLRDCPVSPAVLCGKVNK